MTRELDVKMLLNILRKRLWIIALIVSVSCTAVGIYSYFFIKPIYQASTKLIINSSNDQNGFVKLDLNTLNTNISLINTYKEIIKSPAIMELVLQEHPEFGMTSDQLIKKIKLSSVNETQVLTISIEDPSYEKAATIVNTVFQVFQSQIPKIMKVDNVYLLNKADSGAHPRPVQPNPNLNIAVCFLVSLLCSIGIIFFLEYFDDSIKTEADVEAYLHLPTLAMVTHIDDKDLREYTRSASTQRKVGELSNVQVR